MKLAHLADLHLGFRQFDRQTTKGANQREADVAEAFKRAVDDILEQKPDLIVIAGDLFHSVRPTNAAILYCFRQLHRLRVGLPNAPIVVIAGEHDTPRSTETGSTSASHPRRQFVLARRPGLWHACHSDFFPFSFEARGKGNWEESGDPGRLVSRLGTTRRNPDS